MECFNCLDDTFAEPHTCCIAHIACCSTEHTSHAAEQSCGTPDFAGSGFSPAALVVNHGTVFEVDASPLHLLGRYKEGDYGANAGLKVARDLLEPIKEKFPWISYADLWTLAGATAVEEMGGACATGPVLLCDLAWMRC